MAYCIRTMTLKKVFSSSFPKLNRGYSQSSSSRKIDSHVQENKKSKMSNIVALESCFVAPDNPAVHRTLRTGSGFFVEPNLIVTCAHVVGRIANSYESKPAVEKPEDRFQHGSILHKSYIANTVALARDGAGTVKTTPLAVCFGNNLAVLKVVEPYGENMFPQQPEVVSYSPSNKGDILFNFAMRGDCAVVKTGMVRATGERTVNVKAPWPLDDKVKWTEIGSISIPHDPARSQGLGTITGGLSSVGGSPWFNIVKFEDGGSKNQIIGIASWEVNWDDPNLSPVSFVVPSVYIHSILDYARAKTPEDPIVMDSWIDQVC